MKLRDLEPEFIRDVLNGGEGRGFHRVDSLLEAQGIIFQCPVCVDTNGHMVICWSRSRGAPEDVSPFPGRWAMAGSGFDDLSLNVDTGNEKDSVQLLGRCNAHFHVKNGEVTLC